MLLTVSSKEPCKNSNANTSQKERRLGSSGNLLLKTMAHATTQTYMPQLLPSVCFGKHLSSEYNTNYHFFLFQKFSTMHQCFKAHISPNLEALRT